MAEKTILRSKLFRVGVLYYAEGFPLGVFYEILPVHLRMQGIDLCEIGFLSLPGPTWSVKFLWAPAVDRYRLDPFLPRLRKLCKRNREYLLCGAASIYRDAWFSDHAPLTMEYEL